MARDWLSLLSLLLATHLGIRCFQGEASRHGHALSFRIAFQSFKGASLILVLQCSTQLFSNQAAQGVRVTGL